MPGSHGRQAHSGPAAETRHMAPLLVGFVVALGLVGCSVGTPGSARPSPERQTTSDVSASPTETVLPTADPGWITRPALWCGEGPRFPPEALSWPWAELGQDPAASLLRRTIREDSSPELALPSRGWRRVVDSGTEVLFVAPGTPSTPWIQVTVAALGTEWAVTSYGECHLQVAYPAGMRHADWSLDPSFPAPTSNGRNLHVLVVEISCSGGASPEGRILPPLVIYGSDSVLIAVAVRPLPGANDCVGNPAYPFTVRLAEPLGSRSLLDGGVFPPMRIAP